MHFYPTGAMVIKTTYNVPPVYRLSRCLVLRLNNANVGISGCDKELFSGAMSGVVWYMNPAGQGSLIGCITQPWRTKAPRKVLRVARVKDPLFDIISGHHESVIVYRFIWTRRC